MLLSFHLHLQHLLLSMLLLLLLQQSSLSSILAADAWLLLLLLQWLFLYGLLLQVDQLLQPVAQLLWHCCLTLLLLKEGVVIIGQVNIQVVVQLATRCLQPTLAAVVLVRVCCQMSDILSSWL